MNRVSIAELKVYLGLDGEEQNNLLATLLESAESICEKVLRQPLGEDYPSLVKTAIMYVVWQLYFHRDEKDFNAGSLESTVAVILSDSRRSSF